MLWKSAAVEIRESLTMLLVWGGLPLTSHGKIILREIREHQFFASAIYGTTCLFLEILWGYFCKLSIYSVQECLDGLWQVMYYFGCIQSQHILLPLIKLVGFLFLSLPKISFDLAEYTADVDGVGTLRLLDAIKTCGLINSVKFYQASTSELFGKVQEIPQKETTPFYPRSPYGEDRWWCVCSVCSPCSCLRAEVIWVRD